MPPPRKRLRIATWNINSVRLRISLLERLTDALKPDVLCLQETKAPDELFPLDGVKALGFRHVAFRGMKGYNGVAIASRIPFDLVPDSPDWCARGDCRHLAVRLHLPEPIVVENFYVPAGGDIPDPAANPKFDHKLRFVEEATLHFAARPKPHRTILVGDLNIAPLPDDVWSHTQLLDVVSHTPAETTRLEAWRAAGGFVDAVRQLIPPPERVYTWWSYRNQDWRRSDRGRRLDHVWVTPDLEPGVKRALILKDARDWPQTSDHVPVCVEIGL